MNLEGKRFLITHSIIQGIMGSTVVALELADYLQEQGADVLVYVSYAGNPAIKFFEEKNIRIVGSDEEPVINLADFDYIWVHSQVLPFSIVKQLGEALPARMPIFIFNHMSALEEVADEYPYINGLEESLSSLSVFVSPEAMSKQAPFFSKKITYGLYRNPAPMDFVGFNYKTNKKLKKILIVSNHPPGELIEAKDDLQKKGYVVESLGEKQERDTLVRPSILGEYDLVITIGKTVQFCLVAGIPVYVYDHFGGSGYLNDTVYQATADQNFSGRNGKRKTSNELVADIISGYSNACEYQVTNRDVFIDSYSINTVLSNLLESIKPQKIKRFELGFMQTMVAAQRFGNRFYKYWGWLKDVEKYRDELRTELTLAHDENEVLEKTIRQLEEQNESLKSEIEKLLHSKSYKLGRIVAKPVVLTKRLARRFMRRK